MRQVDRVEMNLDVPVTNYAPTDYDGDGKTDPAVYRQSDGLWACTLSASGYAMQTLVFGGPNYQPAK